MHAEDLAAHRADGVDWLRRPFVIKGYQSALWRAAGTSKRALSGILIHSVAYEEALV